MPKHDYWKTIRRLILIILKGADFVGSFLFAGFEKLFEKNFGKIKLRFIFASERRSQLYVL